jgi:hypothetical protein
MGQFILADPVLHVVVVKLSSWNHAWEDAKEAETYAFFDAVTHQSAGTGSITVVGAGPGWPEPL